MKSVININDSLRIEKDKRKKRTIITLIKDDEKIILSDLKTDEFFWSNILYDENYIIVYSRGCMVNQIPLTIECAYNIKTDNVINTKENMKLNLELQYMYMEKRAFEVGVVLSMINDIDLNISYPDEIEDIKLYLTNGNLDITDGEIKDYILKCFPELNKYTNLNSNITVLQYRDIQEELDRKYFSFHKMPQIIDHSKKDNILLLKK